VFKVEGISAPTFTPFYGIVTGVSTRVVDGKVAYYAKFLTADGEVEYQVKVLPEKNKVVHVEVYETGSALKKCTEVTNVEPSTGHAVVEEVYEETTTRGKWLITVTVSNTVYGPYYFYEGKVLWAEKTSAGYVQRPRPYPGDEVVLYLDGSNVVKVGIVK